MTTHRFESAALATWLPLVAAAIAAARTAQILVAERYLDVGLHGLARLVLLKELSLALLPAIGAVVLSCLLEPTLSSILKKATPASVARWSVTGAVAAVALFYSWLYKGELLELLRSTDLGRGLLALPRVARYSVVLLTVLAVSFLIGAALIGIQRGLRQRLDSNLRRALGRTAFAGSIASTALLAGLALWVHGDRSGQPDSKPHIVLITIDTLRADRIAAYGRARTITPHLDSLASEGILYRRAIAQSGWTLPSMASIHTSLLPRQHGADTKQSPLARRHVTLAEVLREGGYQTLAVVSHLYVSRSFGFAQGFEKFDERNISGLTASTSQGITRAASRMLERRRPDQPFFLWVHYFDPHDSYVRHPEHALVRGEGEAVVAPISMKDLRAVGDRMSATDVDYVQSVYDEEVAFTDAAIGSLLRAIDSAAGGRGVLIVLTADHGELFLEHGDWGHRLWLYDELIRVPLILSGDMVADRAPAEISRPVELAAVPRTVARLAGARSDLFRGDDLLATTERSETVVFSERSGRDFRRIAAVWGHWKLIHEARSGVYELYDLDADPAEVSDLWELDAAAPKEVRSLLRGALDGYLAAGQSESTQMRLSDEQLDILRTLGYVD